MNMTKYFMEWVNHWFPIPKDSPNEHSMQLQNGKLVVLIWSPINSKFGDISKCWQVVVDDADLVDGTAVMHSMSRIDLELKQRAAELQSAVEAGTKTMSMKDPALNLVEEYFEAGGDPADVHVDRISSEPLYSRTDIEKLAAAGIRVIADPRAGSMNVWEEAACGNLEALDLIVDQEAAENWYKLRPEIQKYALAMEDTWKSVEKKESNLGYVRDPHTSIYEDMRWLEGAVFRLHEQLFNFCQPEVMLARAAEVGILAMIVSDTYDHERSPIMDKHQQ